MSDHLDPRKATAQVKRLARAFYRKYAASIGASLPLEDFEQELWVVWHKVSQKYDPSLGASFNTLLSVSCQNRARELARHYSRRRDFKPFSLDERMSEDGSTFLDVIEDRSTETPEKILADKQFAELVLSKMDPRLRQMVELLRDMPDELEAEFQALWAKADLAASLGLRVQIPRRITLNMLIEAFGLSRCTRYRLLDDLKEIMEDV